MALITCPECGKQISDRAPACIHCGFPLELLNNENAQNDSIADNVVSTIQPNDLGYKIRLKSYEVNRTVILKTLIYALEVEYDVAKSLIDSLPSDIFASNDHSKIESISEILKNKKCSFEILKNGDVINTITFNPAEFEDAGARYEIELVNTKGYATRTISILKTQCGFDMTTAQEIIHNLPAVVLTSYERAKIVKVSQAFSNVGVSYRVYKDGAQIELHSSMSINNSRATIMSQKQTASVVILEEDEIKCPRCGSTSFQVTKQGFGFGKAAVGGILLGPVGLVGGAIGSNKIKRICNKCGTTF